MSTCQPLSNALIKEDSRVIFFLLFLFCLCHGTKVGWILGNRQVISALPLSWAPESQRTHVHQGEADPGTPGWQYQDTLPPTWA